MNKIIVFNKNQIENIVKNKNVERFSGKYVTYSTKFKMKAVAQFLKKGMSPPEIFEKAGFDMTVMGKHKPRYLLADWVKIYRESGAGGFNASYRGRPKIIKEELTDKEKIKRLELEIEYLKNEKDFLVRLQARKAE